MKTPYITEAEVEALGITAAEVADAAEPLFRAREQGQVAMPPKTGLSLPGSDAFFHVMPAAAEGAVACAKWVSGAPGNAAAGRPHITALLILADAADGRVLALVEAAALTGLRTAALSLLAARRLALADASRLAFVGCGLQARTHLAALAGSFPVREVLAYGPRPAGVNRFAYHARASGHQVQICARPEEALESADIIVSSVPAHSDLVPFLDARSLPPGAFATMVDLGRSWCMEGLPGFDRCLTDDMTQSTALSGANPTFAAMQLEADLAALVTGRAPGRKSEGERIAFLFPGVALGDLAAGMLVLERLGIGAR